MSYTLEDIKDNWLVDGTIPFSNEQTLEAFNQIKSSLGDGWLNKIKFNNGNETFGVLPTLTVVLLGLKLATLKKGRNYQSLISKLKSVNPTETKKGLAELDAVYQLCNNEPDLDFELEPTVTRQGKTQSYPDFRVKKKDDAKWTYVEVKQPDMSFYNLTATSIINKIKTLFTHSYEKYITLEIVLFRIPTEQEIEIIFNLCIELSKSNKESEHILSDYCLIKMNFGNPNLFSPQTYPALEGKPVYGTATKFQTENGVGLVAVRIVAVDERALKFFDDGSDQLDLNSPGIIFIEGNYVPGILNVWPDLIVKQFKDVPELKNTISAFIVSTSGIENKDGYENEIFRTKSIINENANHKAPEWIINKF
jgi:hypothetical protein